MAALASTSTLAWDSDSVEMVFMSEGPSQRVSTPIALTPTSPSPLKVDYLIPLAIFFRWLRQVWVYHVVVHFDKPIELFNRSTVT